MDEKLVELACEAYHGAAAWAHLTYDVKGNTRKRMRAALAAVNASGTHWVAPWTQSRAMMEAAWQADPADAEENDAIAFVKAEYEAQRDAYLAGQDKPIEGAEP